MKNKVDKLKEAKKLLEKDEKIKDEACQKEIEEVLKKYQRRLVIYPHILINGQLLKIGLER